MLRVKLTSILVNDQNRARAFYTEKLGFKIKHNVDMGGAFWLTLTAPDDPNGMPQHQLYTADIIAECEALQARGVVFKAEPAEMGPTLYADFDDTCGNYIRLVQG